MGEKIAIAGVYSDPTQAHLACLRLEAQGIEAQVFDEGIVTANPLLVPAIGGIRVVVKAADLEQATSILSRPVESRSETPTCPECGSEKIVVHKIGRRLAFLTILFLGFPIGRSRRRFACEDCAHSWRE